MFNKESCRNCGEILVADITCNKCDEITLWICSNLTITVEHIHMHNRYLA